MMTVDFRKINRFEDVIVGETMLKVEGLVIGVSKDERGNGKMDAIRRGEGEKIILTICKQYKIDGVKEPFERDDLTPISTEYEDYNRKLIRIEHPNEN